MTDDAQTRTAYHYSNRIETRWIDNDVYGHVNNAVYYSWFDTVANRYLIEKAGLQIGSSNIVGFIVASTCQYHSPVAYPTTIDACFRVNRLGNRSAEYGIGIFREGEEQAAAHGTFTHVFVDRTSGKAVPIPDRIRLVLEAAR